MGVFVKICGCASAEDVRAVVDLRPDAVGFICWPGSPRYVAPEAVIAWGQWVPPEIQRVGVFVDAALDTVNALVHAGGLDIVQLHGRETPDYCAAVEAPRWKVVHLNREPLVADLESYPVDAFLLDYHAGDRPGGTGQRVDARAAQEFVQSSPRKVVLAGGLKDDTVRQAIEQIRPWGVDVSSGVEQAPGVKDIKRVQEFIQQCRSVD